MRRGSLKEWEIEYSVMKKQRETRIVGLNEGRGRRGRVREEKREYGEGQLTLKAI